MTDTWTEQGEERRKGTRREGSERRKQQSVEEERDEETSKQRRDRSMPKRDLLDERWKEESEGGEVEDETLEDWRMRQERSGR